jgi:predicted XRE-type DNA-binding protein
MGAAVDYSRANSVKASLQAALDSAVLAGAKDGTSKWLTTASNTFNGNVKASIDSRNVWLQLGFADAEEHYLKAELVLRLDKAIRSLGLTQRAAARRIGTTQPELSKILGGKFTEVSLERLMRFLTALGYHIEIKIGASKASKVGEVTIKDVRRRAA